MLDVPRYIGHKNVTDNVFGTDSRILEINSKSGLYPLYCAYNIYRSRVEAMKQKYGEIGHAFAQSLWDATIENNIFVVCKTPMARSITVRTLAGFRDVKVNAKYFPDIIDGIVANPSLVVNTLRDGKRFWKINDDENMKFRAVVGNPPYQLTGGSGGNNDAPLFQHFCRLAEKVTSQYSSLVIPSRWFAAGRENLLGEFRHQMLNSGHLFKLYAYSSSNMLFSNVEIKGGVCYYLSDITYKGKCNYTLITDDDVQSRTINLNRFDILIREPKLSAVVEEVEDARLSWNKSHPESAMGTVDTIISSDTPFGIPSNPRTSPKNPFDVFTTKTTEHDVKLYHIENQKRKIEYVRLSDIKKNTGAIDSVKVFVTGAGGSGNDPKVMGEPELAPRHSVCSQSYLYAAFKTTEEAENFIKYIRTKFFRILVAAMKITQSAPSKVYRFVPLQDFSNNSDIDWSKPIKDIDTQLYKKYVLGEDDINYIENRIIPM